VGLLLALDASLVLRCAAAPRVVSSSGAAARALPGVQVRPAHVVAVLVLVRRSSLEPRLARLMSVPRQVRVSAALLVRLVL